MIQINQIKLPVGHSTAALEQKIHKLLKQKPGTPLRYRIIRRSIDARKKPELMYVYSVLVDGKDETSLVKKLHNPSIIVSKRQEYHYPSAGEQILPHPPVIIGAGPAGLFAALQLTECGYAPIIIERGAPMEERTEDVERFWESGILNPTSNVQFGEGGAGTFSDGKLNSVVKDPSGRNEFVLKTFVKYGAPEQILYENKPHIGTDLLRSIIVSIRKDLIQKGATFLFHHRLCALKVSNEHITGISCERPDGSIYEIDSDVIILAIGHSARDTFEMLDRQQIPMESKNFAVGFRVEHPQSMIDEMMYGCDRHSLGLPASPYKVTSNFPNGRGVYSFCMCPGGYVVNASSYAGGTCVNGMSYSGRNGKNANSAIIVSVSQADFGATDALAGMRYQEKLERANYALAGGAIPQQLFADYVKNTASTGYGSFVSECKGAHRFANLRGLMSPDMETSFLDGMHHFSRMIHKFDRNDAILSGMETRTSSPVRILRAEDLQSPVRGLYPCGEGAGYAGGIMSAAIDGLKVASAVMNQYRPGRSE